LYAIPKLQMTPLPRLFHWLNFRLIVFIAVAGLHAKFIRFLA